MFTDRPKRLIMASGVPATMLGAVEGNQTSPSQTGKRAALFRCLGSNIGAATGELMLLAAGVEPVFNPEQHSAGAQHVPTRSVLLERCRPPARRGFAAFSTAKSGEAPTTGMVAVCSVFPECRWERAFNRWYNHHIDEVFARGIFHTAHRYVTAEPEADGLRRHWAFYETDRDDASTFLPAYVIERRRDEGSLPNFYPPYVRVLGSSVFEPVDR